MILTEKIRGRTGCTRESIDRRRFGGRDCIQARRERECEVGEYRWSPSLPTGERIDSLGLAKVEVHIAEHMLLLKFHVVEMTANPGAEKKVLVLLSKTLGTVQKSFAYFSAEVSSSKTSQIDSKHIMAIISIPNLSTIPCTKP